MRKRRENIMIKRKRRRKSIQREVQVVHVKVLGQEQDQKRKERRVGVNLGIVQEGVIVQINIKNIKVIYL
jgi:hypothetical protein